MSVKTVKCECGHINHEGTVLCEACGKPIKGNQHLDGNDDQKVLEMRYDGSARRSKTYKRTFIDKTWAFFSSVKVGVWLIIITLIFSALGTLYPQEPFKNSPLPASQFYETEYGLTGKIFYQLGFHNMYDSWWYIILVALIGISLVICSLDRYIPLRRALKNQKIKRHPTFVKRQRVVSSTDKLSDENYQMIKERLKKKRYKVKEEDGHLFAEKNRFSRWGPYVNHIGLIIILSAAILRMFHVMHVDDYVWVREGETRVIPGTNQEYYIKNENFSYDFFDAEEDEDIRFREALKNANGPIPKDFQTDAIIYKVKGETVIGQEPELEEVKRGQIRVNHPIQFDGYSLYQAGNQMESEYDRISFKVNGENNQELGEFTFETDEAPYQVELDNGMIVRVDDYYPQLEFTDKGPSSFSKFPRNPGIIFSVLNEGKEEGERFFYLGEEVIGLSEGNTFSMSVTDIEKRSASGLTVKKDYSLPFFLVGAIIFMIGVVQGLYWYHRRIWIHPTENEYLVGSHTNKNWFGMKKELDEIFEETGFAEFKDQSELK
ncbi:cytochrome c biogenesis protein ResB [Allobacillus halotolerans]|uniref:cytochrome c biogenesis protein ResB n=1 Tax=Allobacillus halotolerans TaxID=570278 RepID=UPI001FE2CC21|nr:cytochrome c biogenesis protein ResB [Allobacillus halotolerans]